MKPHVKVTLQPGVPVSGEIPHWETLVEDKSVAPERFHGPIDELLRTYRVPVWVTHEYRPAGDRFSPEEVASGLDRIYRLILQRDAGFPAELVDAIRLLPTVASARLGRIGRADLPPVQARELSATTDTASRQAVGLPEAHAFTRGSREVSVAVLDTGVALDHPELRDTLLPGRDFV